ncbi:MAG TPA: hypothetical protein VFK02_21560 [Kofleriaceae bacterium]|nr:hypothetical protein [Kofleriaceae bacterium]
MPRSIDFLRGAWRTLPVETLAVALAATGAIGLVHDDGEVWFLRLFLAGVVLTPLAFAAHRLGRRVQAAATALAAAGVVAALCHAMSHPHDLDATAFRTPFLLSLLAAVLVPFVASGAGFPRFVRRFFEETTTWTLLWLVAMAAIGVVFLALHELFDLRIQELGADLVVVVTGGFVLVYLHRLLDDAAAPGRVPELWRRLATAIGAPFVCVMLAILVVYEIVVLARGELPRNMLSPLILAAGFVGFGSTLVISSVLGEDSAAGPLAPADPHRWARRRSIRLARAFPIVLLALLPMAGWALWLRIDQHGVTPFRAVRAMGLLCLGALCLAGAIRWLRGRGPLTWELPAAIIMFALVAAFGPLGATHLTISSQRARLARQLDAVGAGREVAATPTTQRIEVAEDTLDELRNTLRVLVEAGGEPALRGVLTGALSRCAERWSETDCLKRLGIYERGDTTPVYEPPRAMAHLAALDRFPVDGKRLAFVELSHQRGVAAPAPGSPEARALDDTGGLVLLGDAVAIYRGGGEVARVPLGDLMAIARGSDRVLPARTLAVIDHDGAPLADLIVATLDLEQYGDAASELTHLSGAILWRH